MSNMFLRAAQPPATDSICCLSSVCHLVFLMGLSHVLDRERALVVKNCCHNLIFKKENSNRDIMCQKLPKLPSSYYVYAKFMHHY